MASSKGSFRLRKRSAGRIKTVPSPTDDAVDQESIMEEGYLQKRGRGRKSSICKIQKRYILLTTDGIFYYNEKARTSHYEKSERSFFGVSKILIVDDVDVSEFGKWYFQVGDLDEVMYFGAKSDSERTKWKQAFKKIAKLSGNVMLGDYHPKTFKGGSGGWSCCKNKEKKATGCHPASHNDGAYFTCSVKERPLSSNRQELTPPLARSFPLPIDTKGKCSEIQAMASISTSQRQDKGTPANESYVQFSRTSDSGIDFLEEGLTNPRNTMEIGSLDDGYDADSILEEKTINNNLDILKMPSDIPENGADDFDEILMENGLSKFHLWKYESSVSTAIFIDVDKLAVATEGKLYIVNPYTEDHNSITSSKNLIALRSWRSKLAVETKEGVTLLDVKDKTINYAVPSDTCNLILHECVGNLKFNQVDFTPDGSCIIGYDFKASNYVIELWNISSNGVSLSSSISLPKKPIKLCVYPDPRVPLVAAIIPSPQSRVLYMHIYNYKTTEQHHDKICIVALEPVHSLHSVFSPRDKNLIIGYGRFLAITDLKSATIQYLENMDLKEEISSMAISPTGNNIILGQIDGSVTVLHCKKDQVVQGYSMDIENKAAVTTVSYSNDDSMLAVGSENGSLHLFKRTPSKHPSEDLKLASITIPQSGGNRTLQDDVSIDFPEGFIDDPRITFKYGVFSADYFGPCLFPPGVRPVSAILVLHPENENVRFKPGVKITMPHCLWLKDAEDCRRVKILKAETADYITVHGRKVLKFNEVSGKEELSLFTEVQNVDNCGKVMVPFASHYSCHCCCYCIGELYMEDTNTAMFCLAQSKPKNLGESSEFLVQYTLSYFLKTCFRNLDERYPKTIYDRKMKCVLFRESSACIAIKVLTSSDRLRTSGWIARILKGNEISKDGVYFWDIPPAVLECMCQEKTYPPGFTIEISTSEYECEDARVTITFPGAKSAEDRYKEEELEYIVDLRVTDVCPAAAKSITPSLHSAMSKTGDQSCEALATQKCSGVIAEGIDSPDHFLMILFSDMILSNKEVMELKGRAAPSMEALKKEDKVLLNFDIMLLVHSKISRDCQIFYKFCDSLEKMNCFRFKKLLNDTVHEFYNAAFKDGPSPSTTVGETEGGGPVYSSTV